MRVTRALWSVVTVAALLVTVALQGGRVSVEEDRDLARLLADAGLTGTIVLASADGTHEYVANPARAATPMLPASTGTWFFATNLEIGLSSITGRREQLIREALRVKGIGEP